MKAMEYHLFDVVFVIEGNLKHSSLFHSNINCHIAIIQIQEQHHAEFI